VVCDCVRFVFLTPECLDLTRSNPGFVIVPCERYIFNCSEMWNEIKERAEEW
jgi:hypothetical protein